MTDQATTQATTTTDGGASSTTADTSATAAQGDGQQQQGAQATAAASTTQADTTTKTDAPANTTQAAAPGAPESYEFKPPEGTNLDAAVSGAFGEVAKELNLTQDNAQKVLDKVMPVMAQRAQEQHQATKDGWLTAAKADKEFGGEKFAENLAAAQSYRDALASPELIRLLDESGLSSHPEFIRMFWRGSKAIREDTFVAGRTAQGGPNTAQRVFSASNMNP